MRRVRCCVRTSCFLLAAALIACLAAPASAQDFRGTITGRVADAQGGRLPGALVSVVNTATNSEATTTTDSNGDFSVPYLTPGAYRVTVELSGFKKIVREGVEVRIGDRLTLDMSLEVGQLEETVTVAAATPLLETRSGSAGQVIDEKRIELMPLSDGNPFMLARLAPGVAYHGDLKFSRPFDNGGTSDFTANGGPGGNEFTLDGSPNMANGRRVAFVPPAGAVQEFKVETATFDAQQGHTAGATVNVTMKSGHEHVPGATATTTIATRRCRRTTSSSSGPAGPRTTPGTSATASPPADRRSSLQRPQQTFFFGAFEWLYDTFPEPGQFTVPTEAQRNGDFSALLPNVVIYDPLTAVRRADGRVERQPFPGNIIPQPPPRSNCARNPEVLPAAEPARQRAGPQQLHQHQLARRRLLLDEFPRRPQAHQQQRFFVRYSRNNRVEYRGNWTGELNGVRPIGNFLFRINDAVNGDHVWTMTPTIGAQPARRAGRGSRSPASARTRASSTRRRSAFRTPRRSTSAATVLPALRVRRQHRSPTSATRLPAASTRRSTRSSRR